MLFCKYSFAVNLQEAVEFARANNNNIKLYNHRLEASKTSKWEAAAEFLPDVRANLSHGQRNSFFEGQTYDRSTKQTTQEIKLEQPIFDGLHSVMKYREAGYKIKSSTQELQAKTQEVSFLAIKAYCDLFRYQKIVKIYQNNLEISKRFLKLANRRKSVKIIDNSELINFNYEQSNIENQFLDATNKLNRANFEYENIIGKLDIDLFEPQIRIEKFKEEKILEAVLSNNSEIKASRYNYLASKAAHHAEKSNFSPKVSLTASASKTERVVYLNNQDLNSRSVMLNLSIPIFQKGVEYASLSKMRSQREVAAQEYEIVKKDITKEVKQALQEYEFSIKTHEINNKIFLMAKENIKIFNKRSKIDDPIEIAKINIASNEKEIAYINAKMDLVIAYYKIKFLLGEI